VPSNYEHNLKWISGKSMLVISRRAIVGQSAYLGLKNKYLEFQNIESISINEFRFLASIMIASDWKDVEILFYYKNYLDLDCLAVLGNAEFTVLEPPHFSIPLLNLELSELLKCLNTPVKNIDSSKSGGYCMFDVLSAFENKLSSSISLRITWKGLYEVAQIPAVFESARVLVHYVGSFAGDVETHESCAYLLMQLEKLKKYRAKGSILTLDKYCEDTSPLKLKFAELLRHLDTVGYEPREVLNRPGFINCLPTRTNIDFLDLLWDFLIELEDFEIPEALRILVECIVQGKIKPMVLKS
jgi:hypothetical protein